MVTLEQVKELITSFISPLEQRIKELQSKFTILEESANFTSKKYDNLLSGLQKTNGQFQTQAKDISLLKQDITIIDQRAVTALNEIEEIAQYIRRDCLEITGIHAKDEAAAEEIVEAVGEHIGVSVSKNDISIAHPLPTRNERGPPKVIVKFTSRKLRNRFYSNRKNLMKTKVSDIQRLHSPSNSNIFVSESLTAKRKKLFGEVNRIKKQRKWKYIWTNNGRIFLKEKDKSPTYIFDQEEDLNKFNG